MEACKRRQGVKGVVLDAALFQNNNNSSSNDAHLQKLLHRLCYSHMRLGFLFRHSVNTNSFTLQKERLKKCMPSDYLFDLKYSSDDQLNEVLNSFSIAWELPVAQCIFLTFCLEDSLKSKLISQGWHLCLPSECANSEGLSFDKTVGHVQELYCQIAHVSKHQEAGKEVIVVGYSMKWSREMDFLKRGALPLYTTDKNISFFPVNLELSLSTQFKILDVMLHKPTDEITSVALGETGSLQDQIRFTDVMQQSIRYLSSHAEICVVDPIERILPLLDRALTQEILQGLSSLEHPLSRKIRAPRYKRVLRFDEVDSSEVLKDCSFSLPAIVKPQTACGISDAHIMAVVFKHEGFLNLAVPVPCTVQEYIDHGSTLYKFYVIGEKVFYSVRKSTPNAATLTECSSDSNVPAVIIFDSLKSLPHHFVKDEEASSGFSLRSNEMDGLDLQLVCAAATWLREKLKLTIFGFDIVIQLNTNDHVIIDVNYFPTFKDVDEQKAVPAFWDALLRAYTFHKESGTAPSSSYPTS
eukprot:c16332_g1_i1 orf=405-1976(-)